MDRIDMIDDGMCFDDHDRQGRSPEQVAANAKATPWIWLAAAVLAVVIALWAAGRAVGL